MTEIPLPTTEVARAIKRSPSYLWSMRLAGYKNSHGTRTLPSHALKWIAAHPDFRTTAFHKHKNGAKKTCTQSK